MAAFLKALAVTVGIVLTIQTLAKLCGFDGDFFAGWIGSIAFQAAERRFFV